MKWKTAPEMLAEVRKQMAAGLRYAVLYPGLLCGMETVRACMKDDSLRSFLGHALLHEIMPNLGLGREDLDPMAMAVCGEMEQPAVAEPLSLLLPGGLSGWKESVLPLLRRYQDREDNVPPCLSMSLSCLIVFYAGVRIDENGRFGYTFGEETRYLSGNEESLRSFARLSCDMAPEMLGYAALSDRDLWGEDLREIPELEEKIADQLRDLQLLGLRASLEKAWRQTVD